MNQVVDQFVGIALLVGGEMGIAGGGQDGAVAEDLLNGQQIDAGFQQMGGVAVAQAVRGDLFFIRQSATTRLRVFWTPPRSSGDLAIAAADKPPWRFGNRNFGCRCRRQNARSCTSVASGNGTSRSLLPFALRT